MLIWGVETLYVTHIKASPVLLPPGEDKNCCNSAHYLWHLVTNLSIIVRITGLSLVVAVIHHLGRLGCLRLRLLHILLCYQGEHSLTVVRL